MNRITVFASLVCVFVSVLVSVAGCATSRSDTPETSPWIELTGPGSLERMRAQGTWLDVGDVRIDRADPKRLEHSSGSGTLLNGPDGRTIDLASNQEFGDVEIDLQFMVPVGSNSGVYVMGRYEIQILDSYGKDEITFGDCGGIYQRWDPTRAEGPGFEGRPARVNAANPPGAWQRYQIRFRAPKFDDNGEKIQDAFFESVIHNGIVIHENEPVSGPTRAAMFGDEQPRGPLMLQGDHGPVAYRMIRIRPLD